jgi:hypothetical protein
MNTLGLNSTMETLRGIVTGRIPFPISVLGATFALLGIYVLYLLIYGLFFCPLRHIPGPFLTRFGNAYWQYMLMAGSVTADLTALHKKYGNNPN